MKYCQVYIRNTPDLYTWHSEKDVSIGDRVQVFLRDRPKFGIIVHINTDKPKFKTQPIIKILDKNFIDHRYIDMAISISQENFCSPAKVINLMIPELFFSRKDPVKREIFYELGQKFTEDALNIRGEKQKEVLKKVFSDKKVPETELKKIASVNTIKNCEKKELIEQKKYSIKNIHKKAFKKTSLHELKNLQEKVFANVMTSKKPSLIWGITGSGKTEIYKKISQEFLTRNDTNQVLFLVPEIALTPQMIEQFQAIFQEKVAVWHSNLTPQEKVQEWARIQNGDARILIGTRSAVLVPFKNPSLIIVDEEHEWTFKNEFNPRYQTHDIIERISGIFGTKLVFGSATPRLESLEKCRNDEWNLFEIKEKIHQSILPSIEVINLENEGKKGNHSPLSEKLLKEIKQTIKNGNQVVLFLNKRGYSGSTMCKSCGHYFECPSCDANMKLHRAHGNPKFICHICGHMEKFPEICPYCKTQDFVFRGWGTQQVEVVLKDQLKDARIIRADADTVTGKYDFEKILEKFHNHEADILLGTQMIAKGLDFERVTLAGIVLADVGLGLPDFRAEERVFQILTQVSGRAGRRKIPGKILIQTFHPENKIFESIRKNETEEFYEWQRETREKSAFPPFTHFAKITFSHIKKETAFSEAKNFFKHIQEESEKNASILNIHFTPAFFPRIHNKFHFHVVVNATEKEELIKFLGNFEIPQIAKVDINPSSLL